SGKPVEDRAPDRRVRNGRAGGKGDDSRCSSHISAQVRNSGEYRDRVRGVRTPALWRMNTERRAVPVDHGLSALWRDQHQIAERSRTGGVLGDHFIEVYHKLRAAHADAIRVRLNARDRRWRVPLRAAGRNTRRRACEQRQHRQAIEDAAAPYPQVPTPSVTIFFRNASVRADHSRSLARSASTMCAGARAVKDSFASLPRSAASWPSSCFNSALSLRRSCSMSTSPPSEITRSLPSARSACTAGPSTLPETVSVARASWPISGASVMYSSGVAVDTTTA